MATLSVDDTKITLTITRSIDGKENTHKYFILKHCAINVMSWPEDELTKQERAKIEGNATDGMLYFLHIMPWFSEAIEFPHPPTYIWLQSEKEAEEVQELLRAL